MCKLSFPLSNFVRISVPTSISTSQFRVHYSVFSICFPVLSQFSPTCQVFCNSCRQVVPPISLPFRSTYRLPSWFHIDRDLLILGFYFQGLQNIFFLSRWSSNFCSTIQLSTLSVITIHLSVRELQFCFAHTNNFFLFLSRWISNFCSTIQLSTWSVIAIHLSVRELRFCFLLSVILNSRHAKIR